MEIEGREITQVLPALAMRGIVMFPTMTLHFDVGREQSMKAIRAAMGKDKKIFLAAQIGRASCRKECRSRWSPYH